jgi:acyl-CoA reductase-like NAD-dependent aldehyde dehydrogenase
MAWHDNGTLHRGLRIAGGRVHQGHRPRHPAIRKLDFGGVIVNDMPTFRADHMRYGGNKQSGVGRQGVQFTIEEMTNVQVVAIRAGDDAKIR